jgi:tetratricopeptide (TPR) repeat protein
MSSAIPQPAAVRPAALAAGAVLAPAGPGEASPTWARLHVALGRVLEVWLSARVAAAFYREAARLDPADFPARFRLGEACARLGRWDEAADAWLAATRLNSSCAEAHGNLALALARAQRGDAAIGALRRLIDLRPNQAELHVLLGALLRRRGRKAEAIRAFRWAVRLDAQPASKRFHLGEALLGTDAWRALGRSYGAAVEMGPQEAAPAGTYAPRARRTRAGPGAAALAWMRAGGRGVGRFGRILARMPRAVGRAVAGRALLASGWCLARAGASHRAIRCFRDGRRLCTPKLRTARPERRPLLSADRRLSSRARWRRDS